MIHLCVLNSSTHRIRHLYYWWSLLSNLPFNRFSKITYTFHNNIWWTRKRGWTIFQARCHNKKGFCKVCTKLSCWEALVTARQNRLRTNSKKVRCQTSHRYCRQYLTVKKIWISLILYLKANRHWRIYTWTRRQSWI